MLQNSVITVKFGWISRAYKDLHRLPPFKTLFVSLYYTAIFDVLHRFFRAEFSIPLLDKGRLPSAAFCENLVCSSGLHML